MYCLLISYDSTEQNCNRTVNRFFEILKGSSTWERKHLRGSLMWNMRTPVLVLNLCYHPVHSQESNELKQV
jgi:hypothetical protein